MIDIPGNDGADPLASLDLPALEQRVRRLEDAVAVIQDDHGLEERVVERLSDRLVRSHAIQVRPTGGLLIDAPRPLLPPPENGSAPPPPTPEPQPHTHGAGLRSWLLFDTLTELRAIFWMFRDPRYRMSWQTRILTLVLLAAILTSGIWAPIPSFVGTIIDKFIDLFLAFVLYKVLCREARRYRETAPDLPHGLRL